MGQAVTEHPAFVCRREGHVPTVTIVSGAAFVRSVICPCRRCGKLVETPVGGEA